MRDSEGQEYLIREHLIKWWVWELNGELTREDSGRAAWRLLAKGFTNAPEPRPSPRCPQLSLPPALVSGCHRHPWLGTACW